MTVSGRRRKRAPLVMLGVWGLSAAVPLSLVAVGSGDDRWGVAAVIAVGVGVAAIVVWACLDMLDDGP